MSGFGECASCGCSVERVGWDDLCFRCQESEKAELVDEGEEWEALADHLAEEDHYLYSIPILADEADTQAAT